jgi:RHS repeat-associated protein
LLSQETFKNGLSFYFEYAGSGPEARCTRTWGDEGIYDHKLDYNFETRRTVVTNSLGYATTYLGNENGLVVEVLDARGGVTQTQYNEFNELLSQNDPLGRKTFYTYDERGNCLQLTLADGAKWQREYDAQDQLTALTDAVGGRWQWTHDEAGNILTQTTPTGTTSCYTYAQGLLVRHVTEALQAIDFLYDTAYNLIEAHLPTGTVSRKLYNGWGAPRKLTDGRGNVQWREYDLLGRVVALYEPDGNVRRFTYNSFGNVVRMQDRHHDVQYAYRGLGRLIRRVEAGVATEYLHDTEEQLRALVNEHGLTYRFELDSIGNVVTETGFDGLERHYQRDQAGQILTITLPTGDCTRYSYDAAGRPTNIFYDNGDWERYAYRSDGALIEATNPTTSVRFERNRAGQILTETQGDYTIASSYDQWGNRVNLASSLGAEVHYTRDERGQLTQMQSRRWSALFERDAQGLELQRSMSGNVRILWKRDSLGRPTEQHISAGFKQAKRTRTYNWQQNNRLTQLHDSQYGLTTFSYDGSGNLAATTFGDAPTEFRSPDAVGNLFKSIDQLDRRYGPSGKLLAARGTQYTYDARGNLTCKITATGDEWQYNWTAAGLLAEVVRPDGAIIRFAYDALGRRVRKTSPTHSTQWVWQGNQPLHEWTVPAGELNASSVAPVTTWLFEEGQLAPLAKLHNHDADYHNIICDYLGTPLQMHDKNGQKSWSAELNSYGAVRVGQGSPQDCPFRYQGQYEDVETGLSYNRFRYYDPEAGIYLSQDPTGLAGGDKPYSYVHNPTVLIDPFGLAPWAPGEFGSWFDKVSVAEVLANKEDVSSALRGSGGMHEMFPVSMAAKAKELGFTHAELMGKTMPRDGLYFNNVPDRFGNIHSGPHSTGMPLPAGQSSKASSWFHKNLMSDLEGATTKSEALAIIERHHTTHCPR